MEDKTYINIEAIGNKVIEVHLRPNPDHQDEYDVLIPIWQGDDISPNIPHRGIPIIESHDDAEGQLPKARLGFCAK